MHPNAHKIKSRVRSAFKALEAKDGFFARANYECCQSCGWAGASESNKDDVVFYHAQDNDGVNRTGKLYLAWAGDAAKIVQRLHEAGLVVVWDGTENTRIQCEVVE